MRLTDRVATLHPLIVTVAFVVWFGAGSLGMNTEALGSPSWALLYTITMAAFLPLALLWHYSIYRAASDRSAEFVGHSGRRAFLFALCALGFVVFLATFPATHGTPPNDHMYGPLLTLNSVAMVVGCLAYFASIWAASNALTRYETKSKDTEIHKTLGTCLLELYFPLGVWFIQPRVKRMMDATALA